MATKKTPAKARSKIKPKAKRRGTPSSGKERKALDALFKTYNRPKDNGDDDA